MIAIDIVYSNLIFQYVFFTWKVALITLLAGLTNAAPQGHADHKKLLSWDEAYSKAEALVSKMSLEDKVGMATGVGFGESNCVGNTHTSNSTDFPSLCLQDGPLGIRLADNVTAGPAGITTASTFDRDLILKRAQYLGKESYGKGVNFLLGPCLDIYRGPYAGRGWEAFGEDPYLQGVAGALTVKGIQSEGVIATAKHFLLNNQELNRTTSSSNIDDRTLREVYLWPYARVVEEDVGSVMCSYNRINHTYACENEYTIETILKGELGFQGAVQTDWFAHMETVQSAKAGVDIAMPGDIEAGSHTSYWGANLTQAVKDGKVSEDRVTNMATRIAAAWYKMGQDKDFPETTLRSFNREEASTVVVSDDHAKIVRELGAAAVVLLENDDNILPLSEEKLSKIALIGSDAGPSPDGLNTCEYQGCDNGTLAMGWGSGTADFPYLVTPKQGIEKQAGDSIDITYTYDDWDLVKAANVASDADVAIVFSNSDSGEEIAVVDGNAGDRNNLSLWHNGDELIKAVADANKNTVVVIHAVGPVLMPWIDHPNIKAVVWPGLPGQESGNSLADVLFGKVNPSGRLPYTIAKKEEDYNVKISKEADIDYTEKLEVGYKHFDANNIEPLYEFGYGLSYTSFKYTDLKVKTTKKEDALVKATITVDNVGDVDGAEVVQAYIGFPESAGEPPKLLRGFEKVFIKKGKKSKVSFTFGKTELSIWDQEWTVPSGEYKLYIGASSRDIRQTATFSL